MIEVENLSKTYVDTPVVNGLSFYVPEGQVLGFLGPNGAGKTTAMRMMTREAVNLVQITVQVRFFQPGRQLMTTKTQGTATLFEQAIIIAGMRSMTRTAIALRERLMTELEFSFRRFVTAVTKLPTIYI